MSDPQVASLLQDATVHAVLAWRSDSIMLARCRLIFMDLIALATEVHCTETYDDDRTCRERRQEYPCLSCRVHDLADRVQRVTKP